LPISGFPDRRLFALFLSPPLDKRVHQRHWTSYLISDNGRTPAYCQTDSLPVWLQYLKEFRELSVVFILSTAWLVKAFDSNSGPSRDFWTLIANGEMLSKQFQAENFKYVPKFFAAAIIGENPQDFGLKLQPLSTYSIEVSLNLPGYVY